MKKWEPRINTTCDNPGWSPAGESPGTARQQQCKHALKRKAGHPLWNGKGKLRLTYLRLRITSIQRGSGEGGGRDTPHSIQKNESCTRKNATALLRSSGEGISWRNNCTTGEKNMSTAFEAANKAIYQCVYPIKHFLIGKRKYPEVKTLLTFQTRN